ncbi:DUF2384 domain-containing protein [Pelomonas sp. V22]|uniref:HAD domain-containing protein n=1 Tax=Pelomonas sp. V22 TaxID=2822139 RepID=UPI0024A7CD83|nr:HAD domain-containing protein [Pelomonas sp. V22]MDI4635205.1 DUF2384 domain-containing protein [Pelomonas sp. V22]
MPSRYLFVDFDGVLHSADAHFEVDNIKVSLQELRDAGLFVHLDLLARILAEHQDVGLVVHSSWRLTHTDDELRQLFGALAGRVVGATDRGLDRQQSISEWALRRQLQPLQYRVLDDQPELLKELGDVVIDCDPVQGLATESAQLRLMDWLNSGAQARSLRAMAVDVFVSTAEADGWLNRPHPLLDGQAPIEHAETAAGEQRVIDMLIALNHGGVV